MLRLSLVGLLGLVACSANIVATEDAGSGTSTTSPVEPEGSGSSTGSTSGSSDPGGSTSGPSVTSGPDDTSTGGGESSTGGDQVPACRFPLPVSGSPCEDEPPCAYGDFCALGLYECTDGTWQFRTTHGCGAEVVECEDGPEAQNGCDTLEACDPDGDCLDVLECDGSNWVEREVCNAIACPEANPVNGQPCDDTYWLCPLEHPCGVLREYRCGTNDHWYVIPEANEVCTEPAACLDGPIPGDACAVDAEVCTFEVPALDSLTCIDGIWT